MTKKKSGLSDSPLFKPVSHPQMQGSGVVYRGELVQPQKSSVPLTTSAGHDQPTEKRRIVRHSFQFYEDQIIALKRLRYETEMTGEQRTLSDFVRAAVDDYLKRHGSK